VFLRSAAVLAGAYVALAALFADGALGRFDQWAVDELMPGARFRAREPGFLDSLVPLLHAGWGSGWAVAANVVTLPAGLLVSLAIAAALSRRLALVLLGAVAVEGLSKAVLRGHDLHHGGLHVAAFDSSFPSGHALRAVVLGGAVAILWPRLRPFALAWVLAAVALLLLAGWHTPTDIAGGVVLGVLALLCARAAGALRARRLRGRT
jgi:membrane-associated phospholipid phosphatase